MDATEQNASTQRMCRGFENVCLCVCVSLAGSWRQHRFDTQNEHQCQANYVSGLSRDLGVCPGV